MLSVTKHQRSKPKIQTIIDIAHPQILQSNPKQTNTIWFWFVADRGTKAGHSTLCIVMMINAKLVLQMLGFQIFVLLGGFALWAS